MVRSTPFLRILRFTDNIRPLRMIEGPVRHLVAAVKFWRCYDGLRLPKTDASSKVADTNGLEGTRVRPHERHMAAPLCTSTSGDLSTHRTSL